MTIYCDLDGTLTHKQDGPKPWPVWQENIQVVRRLIARGHSIVLWSCRGAEKCRKFAETHKIRAIACLDKPFWCFDDTPSLHDKPDRMKPISPEDMVSWAQKKFSGGLWGQ